MGFRSALSLPVTRAAVLSMVALLVPLFLVLAPALVLGQPFYATDATAPGDAMIDRWLAARTARIELTQGSSPPTRRSSRRWSPRSISTIPRRPTWPPTHQRFSTFSALPTCRRCSA